MVLSRLICTSAFLPLCFVAVSPASAAPEQEARTAIKLAYANMDNALVHHNVSAYTAYLHPTFLGVYPHGKEIHGRDGEAASLHQLFAIAKTLTSSSKVLNCSLQEGGAVVTTQETVSLSGTNEGNPIVLKSVDVMRSFWIKIGGKWLIKRERSLSGTMNMNGEETKTLNGQSVPPAP